MAAAASKTAEAKPTPADSDPTPAEPTNPDADMAASEDAAKDAEKAEKEAEKNAKAAKASPGPRDDAYHQEYAATLNQLRKAADPVEAPKGTEEQTAYSE